MTRRNKIISGLVLGTLLTTGLYANNMMKNHDRGFLKGECNMMKAHKNKRHHKMNKKSGMHFLGLFRELNLTNEQKMKMRNIVNESRKNRQTLDDAFTKTSFDKEKFIKIMEQKRENMIKLKAEVLSKSYALLTSKQKEQLKTLMELKKERMQNFQGRLNN